MCCTVLYDQYHEILEYDNLKIENMKYRGGINGKSTKEQKL